MVDIVWYVFVRFGSGLRQFCPMRYRRSSQRSAVSRADSGAVGGEDELAAVHPVVDGLAADLEVAGEFGLLHLGMEVGGAAKAGYVLCCDDDFSDGYVHEVVEGYVVVALVGERLKEQQEPVGVEAESEEGLEHKGGFGVCLR